MSEPEYDPEKMIDAMAAYLGLEIEDAYRPGIALNLTAAHDIARTVLGFETGDETEPAPVFRA